MFNKHIKGFEFGGNPEIAQQISSRKKEAEAFTKHLDGLDKRWINGRKPFKIVELVTDIGAAPPPIFNMYSDIL